MFGRLRSDVAILKESDDTGHKGVIVFIWILTVGVIILILVFALSLVSNIIEAFRTFR